jgi:RNA polymerase sigma-54 factor
MALGPRLDLRQSQQLVMTPQLQQAIRLLALTNLELEAYISAEIDQNPLLDVARGEFDGDGEPAADPPSDSHRGDDPGGESDGGIDRVLSADSGADTGGGDLDVDLGAEVFHHDGASDAPETSAFDTSGPGGLDGGLGLNGAGAITGGAGDGDLPGIEALLTVPKTLQDHLGEQVNAAFDDDIDRLIALHLVDLVEDTGYLREDIGDIGLRLGVEQDHVERVLMTMQGFDPTGVCARSLAECLALQAREANRLDPAMQKLLDNLEMLARGDIPALKRTCMVDHEDMADMIRELRNYNPKPGLIFGSDRVETVVPDIFVRKSPSGSWQVELNTATLPRVLVNRSYYAELTAKAGERADKHFLSECMTSANWLIKALDQRARTILKVASEIVRVQSEFFEFGVRGLRPLTLRAVADSIGMHESTVSRVTTAKYLSSSRGLFELKFFFTSSIASADGGEAHSAEAVKDRIKALVDHENPHEILSDDTLVDLLRSEGFDIARRTVAKYREALRIPSSVQRRRLKAV